MVKRKSTISVSDIKRVVGAVSGTGLVIFGVTVSTDGHIHVATAANSGHGVDIADADPFKKWKLQQNREPDN